MSVSITYDPKPIGLLAHYTTLIINKNKQFTFNIEKNIAYQNNIIVNLISNITMFSYSRLEN